MPFWRPARLPVFVLAALCVAVGTEERAAPALTVGPAAAAAPEMPAAGKALGEAVNLDAAEEAAFRAAMERVAPSVVRIETVGGLERVEEMLVGTGPTTGLIVEPDGWIVSSAFNFAHQPSSILVRLPDGARKPARLVATDHSRMLALLHVEVAKPLPAPEFAPLSEIRVGQWALALGRAMDAENVSLDVGVISALGRIWGKAIQTDASISPNNYGGPLVDIRGRVMGVLVPLSMESGDEMAGVEWYDSGIGFAIPAEFIRTALPRLKRGEDLRPGVIGLRLKGSDLSPETIVAACPPGTPAALAGLKAGDRIVSVDGAAIGRPADLRREIERRYAGDVVNVAFMRGAAQLTREIALVAALEPYEMPSLGILPARSEAAGISVRYVLPKSPAEAAGVMPGDRIIACNGAPLQGPSDLRAVLAEHAVGDEIELALRRAEATVSAKVRLARLSGDPPPRELPPRATSDANAHAEFPPVTLTLPQSPIEITAWAPENSDAAAPCGLLVWLHGDGGLDAADIAARWQQAAGERRLIVVAPKSSDGKHWLPTELALVPQLLQTVRDRYAIDPARIVLAGEDEGGEAAWVMATRIPTVRGAVLVNAVPRTRAPSNDPTRPFALYLVQLEKGARATASKRALESLEKQRLTSHVKSVAGETHSLSVDEVEEIVRWTDALDRI